MLLSDKRLEANRKNAQKSTGPKTPEGKTRASQNALTHGLCSHSSALLPTESEEAYQAFCQQMLQDLHPRSALEASLAERITLLTWRLRRLPAAEAALFQQHNDSRRQAVQQANARALQQYHHETEHYRDKQR